MKNNLNPLNSLALAALLGAAGCARFTPDGQALFGAMEQAAASAVRSVEPSIVLVKVQQEQTGGSVRQVGGLTFRSGGTSGPKQYVGVLLSEEGHLLVPAAIKPDIDDRIEVLVGDNEYPARPIKVDDQLGMSILKIDADEPLTPLNLEDPAELGAGAWAVLMVPTDEAMDYEKLLTLAFCRGEEAGRYRKYILDMMPRGAEGAPVVDLSGRLVGLATQGGALALRDLKDDLQAFLDEATGVLSPDEAERRKGWLGAFMEPINRQYAKAHDFPTGALWVVHIVEEGPAEAAGLQKGDLLVELNGEPLRFSGKRALEYFLQSLRPRIDEPFELGVLRTGAHRTCQGRFGEKPEPDTMQAEDLGLSVSDITDAEVFSMNLFVEEGVRVTDVERGGPAATSSRFGQGLLTPNDIIVELAGQPTPDIEAFSGVLQTLRREHSGAVLVKYWRGRVTGYAGLNLTLGEKDNGGPS